MEEKLVKILKGFITDSDFIYEKKSGMLKSECGKEEFQVENGILVCLPSRSDN